jgi:xanthine dehydrogenase YagR molybdenum-binding subunit
MSDARPRVDGLAKVTGAARYAAEWPAEDLRHLALVTAPVPAATITDLDTAIAERSPGVIAVLTHRSAPRLSPPAGAPYGGRLPLQDNKVRYEGEPVAVVVADTLDRAQDAARLIRVTYETHAMATDLGSALDSAV